MQTRHWQMFDIHFNEDEQDKVEKMIEDLEQKGWQHQQTDGPGANGYPLVAQLLKGPKIKNIKPRKA